MIRKVVTFPDPLLNRVSAPVAEINDEVRDIARDMVDTMRAENGVGISAVQIGFLMRIVVVLVTKSSTSAKEPEVMINPKIISKGGFQCQNEGCLSFPGVFLPINRYATVEVEYQDLSGLVRRAILNEMESVCLQHEIDHLDGVVFVSKANPQSPFAKGFRR